MHLDVRRAWRALAAVTILGLASAGASSVAAIGSTTAIVTTAVHDSLHNAVTSIVVGSTVHPSFVVSGAAGTPTGGIGVEKWNNATCSGTHAYIYGGVLTNGQLDAGFLHDTSNDGTTISYRGSYDGDGTYGAALGTCTSLTFTKASPAVSLHMRDVDEITVTSVGVTTKVHAFVSVSGRVDAPTGSVRIRMWPNGTCTGFSSLVGPYALVSSQVDTPYQWPMDTIGSFSFRADYLGDSTYSADTSLCVVLKVVKWTPTFTTAMHDPSHAAVSNTLVGVVVHPAVSLSGAAGVPTGTVFVLQYASPSCGGAAELVTQLSAASSIDPAGPTFVGNVPGTESWTLSYGGSTLYATATGPCMAVTWRATPTVSATVHDAAHHAVTTAPVKTSLHLKVTVGGDFATPTGQVKVTRYANGTCSGAGTTMGTASLTSGVLDKTSLAVSFTTPGTYSFKAAYLGDGSYVSRNSACVPVTITAAVSTPAPTTAPTSAPTIVPPPTPQSSSSAALPSAAPSATAGPAPSNPPAPSPAPSAAGATEPGTTGLGTTRPGATAAAQPSAGGGPTTPSADGGTGLPWLLILLVLVVVAIVVGVWFSRRRRANGKGAAQP